MYFRLAFVCGVLLFIVLSIIFYCYRTSREPDEDDYDDLGYLSELGGETE